MVATASGESARLWDATTGRELLSLIPEAITGIDSAAFSPDGKFILTTSLAGGSASIWLLPAGLLRR